MLDSEGFGFQGQADRSPFEKRGREPEGGVFSSLVSLDETEHPLCMGIENLGGIFRRQGHCLRACSCDVNLLCKVLQLLS